jgi:hypothetical protein
MGNWYIVSAFVCPSKNVKGIRYTLSITTMLLSTLLLAGGAGVTVITHGLNGNADGWVTGMAQQITNYPTVTGSGFSIYKIYLNYNGTNYVPLWNRIGGISPTNTASGEIIVAFDWSQLASGNSSNTYQIATSLSSILQTPGFIPELNGHALCELPMHLIGHSRGGSVMSETSLRLGTNGIWTDHLTTLDPHPLNNDIFTDSIYSAVDAPVRTYETVLFHDNYWQSLNLLAYGESVFGAYIRQLTSLSGGYQSSVPFTYQHSNVHLWYHGTIDRRNPASDTEAQITSTQFANWYAASEQKGTNAGFEWSLMGGGNRTATNQPLGSGAAIRDGFNQEWDLGAGTAGTANRTNLPAHNGSWPNIIRCDIVGPTNVPLGGVVSNRYYFQYGISTNQNATVELHLDNDANAFNGDAGQILQIAETGTGTNVVRLRTVAASLTNVPAGQYHVFAKVTDGTHTRYLYAPQLFTVGSPTLALTKTGTNIVVTWPTNIPGFQLQWGTNVSRGFWSNASPSPVIVNGSFVVTNGITNGFRVYRLLK